ncbi:MAG: GIN domain-containing protein [Bacteroidota bacterium]
MTIPKTMNVVPTILLGLSVTLLQAQQIRNVTDFNGIIVGDAFNVTISQSDANTVKVDADERTSSQIKTEVKNEILTISTDENISSKPVTIMIGVKSLNHLEVSGSADVKTGDQLLCDKLMIISNGAGNVQLDLKINEVKINLSGAGDLMLTGSAQLLDAVVSGAGDLKASDLETIKVIAKVSGAGNARVNAVQALNADVAGAGSIIYKGNPVERNVNINGAGSVRESKSGTGEETAGDTTKFRVGKKKYMIIDDEADKERIRTFGKKDSIVEYNKKYENWRGIELGINLLLDYKNTFNTPGNGAFLELDNTRSIQFGLNLFEKDFHIYKNHLNLVTGFGFDFNHYAFKNNITLNPDTSYLSATTDITDYKKNKLNISYIKVPLLLEINTSENPKNNFHIAGGIEFAYRIHSVTKQKYDAGDRHYKNKTRDDFNLEPFRYSLVARIGYNNVTVFANYGLNRLFQKDKGPQIYPFTIGLSFNKF